MFKLNLLQRCLTLFFIFLLTPASTAFPRNLEDLDQLEESFENGEISEEEFLALLEGLDDKDSLNKSGEFAVRLNIDAGMKPSPRLMAPPTRLRLFSDFRRQSAGLTATLSRNAIRGLRYDPHRKALSVEKFKTKPNISKGFVVLRHNKTTATLGFFQVFVGSGLTLASSNYSSREVISPDFQLSRPPRVRSTCLLLKGEKTKQPCNETVDAITDFSGTRALLGGGILFNGIFGLPLSMDIFFSRSPRAERSTRVNLSEHCEEEESKCASPRVFQRNAHDPIAPQFELASHPLPKLFREDLYGANVSMRLSKKLSLGIVGYLASHTFLSKGAPLEFKPDRGFAGTRFGSVGLYGNYDREKFEVRWEVAHFFKHSLLNRGSLAAVVSVSPKLETADLGCSGYFYSRNFANPFSRSIASFERFRGNRFRNEQGVRCDFASRTKNWGFTLGTRLWSPLSKRWRLWSRFKANWFLSSTIRIRSTTRYQSSINGNPFRIFIGKRFLFQPSDLVSFFVGADWKGTSRKRQLGSFLGFKLDVIPRSNIRFRLRLTKKESSLVTQVTSRLSKLSSVRLTFRQRHGRNKNAQQILLLGLEANY